MQRETDTQQAGFVTFGRHPSRQTLGLKLADKNQSLTANVPVHEAVIASVAVEPSGSCRQTQFMANGYW
jgi:hypothetical protein